MAFLRSSSRKLLLFSSFFLLCSQNRVLGAPQVPCYFIFGDSFSDNGNNNNLATVVKSNYLPYGIDFPGGPTGRFTNGPTYVDFIALLLGFDRYIRNFTDALTNQDFVRGVNYASGAAGIRDETGFRLGDRISFNHQLGRHFYIIAKIRAILGDRATNLLLNECIYTVEMGTNDYANNYFMPQFYPTSRLYTPQQFAVVLVNQYARQLMYLYDLGARKVAIIGLGLLGCAPQELSKFSASNGSTCIKKLNDAVIMFNDQLRPLVQRLNSNRTNATFTLIDMVSIANSSSASLPPLDTRVPCCETITSIGTCKPNGAVCANRDSYAYFDGYHSTRIVSQSMAAISYDKARPSDAYPYDIHQLAMM
ncbi:hypothetical protein MLD38_014885 [Melastoma candidum]|uniref:Uncharacterized protein n=1 Tax=Melastoma candidum TaxID=119954 RepID=A0ACB9RE45_9MYRT|nr:hypothetical protein MLD38_014885 [Melastoma candidum]